MKISNITEFKQPMQAPLRQAQYRQGNNSNENNKLNATPNFGANIKPSNLDKILNNKLAQKIFKFASLNSFGFNAIALAATCMVIRPATILVVPGASKEDREYTAGKSVISSAIANVSRLLFIYPLGLYMKHLGEKAAKKADPIKQNFDPNAKENLEKFEFPKYGTKDFDVFNYAVNNTAGVILAVGTSALMVYAVAKIMGKIMPEKPQKEPNKGNDQLQLPSKELKNAN